MLHRRVILVLALSLIVSLSAAQAQGPAPAPAPAPAGRVLGGWGVTANSADEVNAGKAQPISFSLSENPIVITNNGANPTFGTFFFAGVTYQLSPNVWNLDQVEADIYPTALATGGPAIPEGHLSLRLVRSMPTDYFVGKVVLSPDGDPTGQTLPCLFVDVEKMQGAGLQPAFDPAGADANLEKMGLPRKVLAAALFGKAAGGTGGAPPVPSSGGADPNATKLDTTVVAPQGDGTAVKTGGDGTVVDDKGPPPAPPKLATFTR